jgi:hypothetical protein
MSPPKFIETSIHYNASLANYNSFLIPTKSSKFGNWNVREKVVRPNLKYIYYINLTLFKSSNPCSHISCAAVVFTSPFFFRTRAILIMCSTHG